MTSPDARGHSSLMTQAENRELNLKEYAEGAVTLRSRPRFILVELTQGCNLRCPMCRPNLLPARGRSMSDELFSRIAGELFGTAEMVDLRGWGESLILPDVARFIEEASRAGARVRFVTNLSFQRDDILDVLSDHRCDLAVSLDSADPHLLSEIRGGANLSRIAKNIDTLVAAYTAKHGSADQIYLTVTVQRPALETLPDLIDFAADHGIHEVRLFAVTIEPHHTLSLVGAPREVDESITRASERAHQRGVKLFAGTRLGSMPEKPADEAACIHPWSYAFFAYDGRVGFCDHLIGPDGEKYLLGNLAQSSFEEIWNGSAWRKLRREHLSARNPHAPNFEECAWCYKNRHIDFEHLFDPEADQRRVALTPASLPILTGRL